MKKFILLMFVFLTYLTANSATYTAKIGLDDVGIWNEYYETVHIQCYKGYYCQLICTQEGVTTQCNWASATWCEGCEEEKSYFQIALGQELYDYAKDQINNNVLTGTYTNNLVAGPKTYYRTITWSADLITQEAELELTITE